MIINIFVVVTLLLYAALWGSRQKGRGVFSAMLNLACVLAAGAIAIAAWEPISTAIIAKVPALTSFAWCFGLLVPFALAQILLRVLVDQTVKANLDFDDISNFVGGAVCGVLAGVVVSGIAVLGMSSLRVGPSLLGYSPLTYDNGSPVYSGRLWLPTDRWTVALYEAMSLGGFSSDTPLATRMPRADEQMAMMRSSYVSQQESRTGIARTTSTPDEFDIKGAYSISDVRPEELTEDTFNVDDKNKPKPHNARFPDDSSIQGGDTLVGYIVDFHSSAFEKSGQIVLGPTQVRLVCATGDDRAIGVHPVAAVALPEAGGSFFRFRFDTGDVFIPSVGGQSNATFILEFVVPKGATPTDFIFRNARATPPPVDPKLAFAGFAKRDQAIRDGSIFKRFGAVATAKPATASDLSSARTVVTGGANRFSDLMVNDQLPESMVINAGDTGGIETENNQIAGGSHIFPRANLVNNRTLGRELRVDRFATTKDTSIVQVTLANKGAMSLLGQAVEAAQNVLPPLLADSEGHQYEAVGFIYDDGTNVTIRYTPGQPLRGLTELPGQLSRSKRDQTAILIFRVTKGTSIATFGLSGQVLAKLEPPVKVDH